MFLSFIRFPPKQIKFIFYFHHYISTNHATAILNFRLTRLSIFKYFPLNPIFLYLIPLFFIILAPFPSTTVPFIEQFQYFDHSKSLFNYRKLFSIDY